MRFATLDQGSLRCTVFFAEWYAGFFLANADKLSWGGNIVLKLFLFDRSNLKKCLRAVQILLWLIVGHVGPLEMLITSHC